MNWIKKKFNRLAAWWLFDPYAHSDVHVQVFHALEDSCPQGMTYSLHEHQQDAIVQLIERSYYQGWLDGRQDQQEKP